MKNYFFNLILLYCWDNNLLLINCRKTVWAPQHNFLYFLFLKNLIFWGSVEIKNLHAYLLNTDVLGFSRAYKKKKHEKKSLVQKSNYKLSQISHFIFNYYFSGSRATFVERNRRRHCKNIGHVHGRAGWRMHRTASSSGSILLWNFSRMQHEIAKKGQVRFAERLEQSRQSCRTRKEENYHTILFYWTNG